MKAQKLTVLVLTALLGAACAANPQNKTEAASSTAKQGTKPQPSPSPSPSPSASPSPSPTPSPSPSPTPSPSPSPSPSPTPIPEKGSVQLQKLNQGLTEQLVQASSGKPEKVKFQAMDILVALNVTREGSGSFVNLTPTADSQWLELQKSLSESECANLKAGLEEVFSKSQGRRAIVSAMNSEFWTKFCQISRSKEVRQRYSLRLRADGAVDFNFAPGESVESKESITFDLMAPMYVNVHAFQKIEATLAFERILAKQGETLPQMKNVLPAAQGLNDWYAWARTLETIRKDILTPLKAMSELPKEQDMKLAQTLLGGVNTWLSQVDLILANAEEAQMSPLKRLVNAVRMDQDSSAEKSPSDYSSQAKQAIEALSSHLYGAELLKLDIALAELPKACSESYRRAKEEMPDTVPFKAFEKMILLQGAQLLESISPGAKALAEDSLKAKR